MEITLNEDVMRFLIDESRHRFTRHEAFESLFSMIVEAEEGVLRTSFNRLSKVWNWDNHQVSDFIGKLMEIGVLVVLRNGIISKEPFKEERKTRRLVSQNII